MFPETWKHEVGIASNRKSARYGEIVTGSCTHRPSHPGNGFDLKKSIQILVKKFYIKFFKN